jgi:MFS family permease
MFISNTIKVGGCLLMLIGIDPLVAYSLVGLGAASYSPAKYGILTEYLPHSRLVAANGWIEGLTVGSIILGTVLGGVLITPKVSGTLLAFDLPFIDSGLDTSAEVAIAAITIFYVVAAIFNLYIPCTGVALKPLPSNPWATLKDFSTCCVRLWRDKLGQISLSVTTLFWGAGATLQFIVIAWADAALDYDLSQASILQGVVAAGIAAGAMIASIRVSLDRAVSVVPLGAAMGIIVIGMIFVHEVWIAVPLLVVIGALAGFFVVPMNALLQHRGHHLMGAGRSIAVQNFNENASILLMLWGYSSLLKHGTSINIAIVIFGLFIAGTTMLVRAWHRRNLQRYGEEMQSLLTVARSAHR